MKNKKSLFIIGGILLVVVILIGSLISKYNSLVTLDEEVTNKYATIDVQLQRRADLIPNLISTVKGYMAHEQEVIDSITEARANLKSASGVKETAEANEQLTTALNNLLVVVENYPTLKADTQFTALQDELAGTENRISVARKDYNDAVKQFNSTIKKFPNNLFANMLGFEVKEYFEASENANEVPNVSFE